MDMTEKIARITPARMKDRGWTESMVKNLLGKPDVLIPNPHYRSGPAMRLYDLTRVEAAEAMPAFITAREKAAKRSEVGLVVADRRRKQLLDEISGIEIRVSKMPFNQLAGAAINHYNNRGSHRDNWEMATRSSSPEFLRRIMVNYARHELSHYDDQLDVLFARIGKLQAITLIRAATYTAIAATWPELSHECARQEVERSS